MAPAYLAEQFGRTLVPVHNHAFDLTDLMSLDEYLRRHFVPSPAPGVSVTYVRWYTKFRDTDFVWADDVFAARQPHWQRPYFLPDMLLDPALKEFRGSLKVQANRCSTLRQRPGTYSS